MLRRSVRRRLRGVILVSPARGASALGPPHILAIDVDPKIGLATRTLVKVTALGSQDAEVAAGQLLTAGETIAPVEASGRDATAGNASNLSGELELQLMSQKWIEGQDLPAERKGVARGRGHLACHLPEVSLERHLDHALVRELRRWRRNPGRTRGASFCGSEPPTSREMWHVVQPTSMNAFSPRFSSSFSAASSPSR